MSTKKIYHILWFPVLGAKRGNRNDEDQGDPSRGEPHLINHGREIIRDFLFSTGWPFLVFMPAWERPVRIEGRIEQRKTPIKTCSPSNAKERKTMTLAWKENWEQTKQNFTKWWNREGFVLGMYGAPLAATPHEDVPPPERRHPRATAAYYTETDLRARMNHYDISLQSYPADVLPIADTELGPGSLAFFLGCEPDFKEDTVWTVPSLLTDQPENLPPIRFDPSNRWWQVQEKTLRQGLELGWGKYLLGLPDMYGGMDILGLMRGVERLMLDMIDRPEWVARKIEEIDRALFEVTTRIYDMIKLEDGSVAEQAFRLWGPGKTLHIQCDLSAMISPKMFEQFVLPFLKRQCQWFDYTMFHLDGPDCVKHLDMLLDIEELDAIEWTPGPKVPQGGSPEWYEMYRKILNAGKALQAYFLEAHEVVPLLDAIGGKGVYVLGFFTSEAEVEKLQKDTEPFR